MKNFHLLFFTILALFGFKQTKKLVNSLFLDKRDLATNYSILNNLDFKVPFMIVKSKGLVSLVDKSNLEYLKCYFNDNPNSYNYSFGPIIESYIIEIKMESTSPILEQLTLKLFYENYVSANVPFYYLSENIKTNFDQTLVKDNCKVFEFNKEKRVWGKTKNAVILSKADRDGLLYNQSQKENVYSFMMLFYKVGMFGVSCTDVNPTNNNFNLIVIKSIIILLLLIIFD